MGSKNSNAEMSAQMQQQPPQNFAQQPQPGLPTPNAPQLQQFQQQPQPVPFPQNFAQQPQPGLPAPNAPQQQPQQQMPMTPQQQQQQQQMQMSQLPQMPYAVPPPMGYGGGYAGPMLQPQQQYQPQPQSTGRVTSLPQGGEGDVVAVIVTLCASASFDPMFAKEKQIVEGGRVAVYSVQYGNMDVEHLSHCLGATEEDDTNKFDGAEKRVVMQLQKDIQSVDPECVVFNFECCGGCSTEKGFRNFEYSDGVMKIVKQLLDKSHMLMFSDFSLKALLARWDESKLGPKVGREVGSLSSSMELTFKPEVLKECVSQQLVAVGELCSDGHAVVGAMGGTIMYDLTNVETDAYKVEKLTSLRKADTRDVRAAGHAVVTYPSGGCLLLSCGHWVELQSLGTTEENVKARTKAQMGEVQYAQWENVYNAAPVPQQQQMQQMQAQQCVMSSAPCQYMNKKGY